MKSAPELRKIYRDLLFDGILPFWRKNGIDRKNGGVFTCLTEEGRRISDEKYIWSQGRWLWVCSSLYNRVEKRPEFLEWARETADFLLHYGRDTQGKWVFRTDATGHLIEGHTSIFVDCFVTYGLSEFYRATGDRAARTAAEQTFARILSRIEAPDFSEIAPFKLPPGLRIHSVPMIVTEVANEFAQSFGHAGAEAAAERYALEIMDHFVRPEKQCLLEFLTKDLREAPAPAGTFVIPGHAIESMWFILHWARRRGRADIVARACEVIRWHMEKGWDAKYGGIVSGMDLAGGTPFWPNPGAKVWWTATESLYALQLAHRLCGQPWCLEWYERMHDWAFSHYPMPEGEWRQRLDREGRPITTVLSLPVKDPFHLPRAVILLLQVLS